MKSGSAKSKLRILHQFPRTGGTIISRALAAMDGVLLFSEITTPDLIKKINAPKDVHDILHQARDNHQLIDQSEFDHLQKLPFPRQVQALVEVAEAQNTHLVIRAWDGGDYLGLNGVSPTYKSRLAAELDRRFDLVQFCSVRHPSAMFASLARMWGLSTSNARHVMKGYFRFSRMAKSTGFVRYEDFVVRPGVVAKTLCDGLELPFDAEFETKMQGEVFVTGDSRGMEDGKIRANAIPKIADALTRDDYFLRTIKNLEYDDPR